MSAADSIVLGVVAGVIATLVVLAANVVIRRVVLPWYQDFIYDGVDIAGEWDLITDTEQRAKLLLTQSAYTLHGTVTFVARKENPEGYESLRTCAVIGKVRERHVELSFRHVDRARLGAGVFLLEVKGDGRRMVGVQAMYSVASSQMTSAEVVAMRPGFLVPAQKELPLHTRAPRKPKKTPAKETRVSEPPPLDPPRGPIAGG